MASKGNYYKLKTRQWFRDHGYECELLEKNQRIFVKGKIIFTKKDVFGSDGLAICKAQIIFWNSKLGKKNIAKGLKELEKYPWPNSVKRWVVAWEKGARQPDIVETTK